MGDRVALPVGTEQCKKHQRPAVLTDRAHIFDNERGHVKPPVPVRPSSFVFRPVFRLRGCKDAAVATARFGTGGTMIRGFGGQTVRWRGCASCSERSHP